MGLKPVGLTRTAGAAVLGVVCFGLVGLSACDGGGSATPARSHAAAGDSGSGAEARWEEGGRDAGARTERVQRATLTERSAEAPLFKGRPMWADNRRNSAEENAQYQFEHHGEELGAKTLDAFLTKAHAFVGDPPKSALSMTRANGDTLMFDPASGLFAVARNDGAPRTVFKPDDGMAYWRAQEAQAGADEAPRARSARTNSGGDRAGSDS